MCEHFRSCVTVRSGRVWEVLSLGDSALIAGAIYSELSRCGMALHGAWSREHRAEQTALSRCGMALHGAWSMEQGAEQTALSRSGAKCQVGQEDNGKNDDGRRTEANLYLDPSQPEERLSLHSGSIECGAQ
ncbi:hypothetical protein RRG08_011765 [Elysia crispata]|uniref:Uncharacterized protein n=1 Tax=Elysia crispata TaxID=231223 RepID=A0AAE0ZQL3_9GAST|nr:hypothetical protein RRG08_011765 [Elysia crispata]